jgi:hypothetical protein
MAGIPSSIFRWGRQDAFQPGPTGDGHAPSCAGFSRAFPFYAARNATRSKGTASLKLDSDPLGSQFFATGAFPTQRRCAFHSQLNEPVFTSPPT